jgi:hypothetical protein
VTRRRALAPPTNRDAPPATKCRCVHSSVVTSDNRDSASRLSDALDDLFERRASPTRDDTDPTVLGAPDVGAPESEISGEPSDDSLPLSVDTPDTFVDTDSSTRSPSPQSGSPQSGPPPPLPPELPPVLEPVTSPGTTGPYVLPPIVLATEPEPAHDSAPDTTADTAADTAATPVVPRVAPGPAMPPTSPPPAAVAASSATSWGDHMPVVSAPPAGELRAAGRRPRVRRVTRVIRHVDPWSVFKVGLIFSIVGYVVLLSSGVLLWRVAESTGSIDNVERWFTQFGWETFEFKGDELFRNAWIIGLFGVVAMTGALVLMATLFNLVSDIVGGVRVTVLEEEVVERTMSNARRYVVRRPVDAGTAGVAASNWSVDDDEPVGSAATQPPEVWVSAASPSADSDWSADD